MHAWSDNQRNANMEEQEDYQDARARHMEERREYDVDFTTSLRELVATGNCSHQLQLVPIHA